MTRKAPTIRELDERKRERDGIPNYAALDTFMGIFGLSRVSSDGESGEPANCNPREFEDWT